MSKYRIMKTGQNNYLIEWKATNGNWIRSPAVYLSMWGAKRDLERRKLQDIKPVVVYEE